MEKYFMVIAFLRNRLFKLAMYLVFESQQLEIVNPNIL